MQHKLIDLAAAALMAVSFATSTAATSNAAQVERADTTPDRPSASSVELLDCRGSTGPYGCGPGWFWRDGWRGLACYPC